MLHESGNVPEELVILEAPKGKGFLGAFFL